MKPAGAGVESPGVNPTPSVTCAGCAFAWHSETMVHGLRIIGSCPRCGGGLVFADDAAAATAEPALPREADERPPHAVLGIPRR